MPRTQFMGFWDDNDIWWGMNTSTHAMEPAYTDVLDIGSPTHYVNTIYARSFASPTSTPGTTAAGWTGDFTNGDTAVANLVPDFTQAATADQKLVLYVSPNAANYVVASVAADGKSLVLDRPFAGPTANTAFGYLLFGTTASFTVQDKTLVDGIRMVHGVGAGGSSGSAAIRIATKATQVDTGAAVIIQNYGLADAIYIGMDPYETATPIPTGIGIDLNRSDQTDFQGGAIRVSNFSTTSGCGIGFDVGNQVGNVAPCYKAQTDGLALYVVNRDPAPAKASQILVQASGGGAVLFSVDNDGTISKLNSVTVPVSVTGAKGGNAALADLITQLASLGLIVDNTT